ncbi:receptor-like protein kinase [Dorcoceras hygrometricum]|uniref:Receptor-like protein kinase n=1 Tax=Dorcoceras hygrometricum TaxID=472368 RepID=A0A2Z6ZTI2_9LAMI|nr:receptor-like protein kinase [Dorcoceras hygrometricum]
MARIVAHAAPHHRANLCGQQRRLASHFSGQPQPFARPIARTSTASPGHLREAQRPTTYATSCATKQHHPSADFATGAHKTSHRPPVRQRKNNKQKTGRRSIRKIIKSTFYDIHRMFSVIPRWHLCLAPTGVSRTRRFLVDCGRYANPVHD